MEKEPILTVKDLSIAFHMYDKGLEQYDLKVISNLDLDVYPGEIVAIAGSSGSGKSLLAHAVMGLLPENALLSGTIAYKGKILDQADKEKLRGKELALVPQSVAYLDPLMRIGTQVSGKGAPKKKVTLQKKIFQRLQLKENVEKLYPFQLSGGMARRVLVSTAVLSGADVIIADEPTPGLDLEMALETLKIFRELADEGKAIVLITHDIDLAFHIADRVAVFMQERLWKSQMQTTFWKVRKHFVILIQRLYGKLCHKTDLSRFRDFSLMQSIFPEGVCIFQDVRTGQTNVRKKSP